MNGEQRSVSEVVMRWPRVLEEKVGNLVDVGVRCCQKWAAMLPKGLRRIDETDYLPKRLKDEQENNREGRERDTERSR